ncbi:hypothetical protein [Streptomyces sp. NPDC050287]|uniref:hypothetical protein n=1 Tax=Streptomyces sp. NPDC050287 TaxID=3365608 RepID=UPI0037AAE7D4
MPDALRTPTAATRHPGDRHRDRRTTPLAPQRGLLRWGVGFTRMAFPLRYPAEDAVS